MTCHLTYADGQAFDVELTSHESIEWFLHLDFPNGAFDGESTSLRLGRMRKTVVPARNPWQWWQN